MRGLCYLWGMKIPSKRYFNSEHEAQFTALYGRNHNIWHLLWMQISVEILRLLDAADDIWAVVLDVQRALNYDIVTSVTAEITRGDLCG